MDTGEQIGILRQLHYAGAGQRFMSLDVEDLFYNLPMTLIEEGVREAVGKLGQSKFRENTMLGAETFFKLLELYLRSTIIREEGRRLLQKEGICIGCSIAPRLADLCLGAVNRRMKEKIQKRIKKIHISRYVDDYLFIYPEDVNPAEIKKNRGRRGKQLEV